MVTEEGAANLGKTKRSFTKKMAHSNRPVRMRVISSKWKVGIGE